MLIVVNIAFFACPLLLGIFCGLIYEEVVPKCLL